MNTTVSDKQTGWPALPLAAWSDTYKTLHLWLQMVGKVRLAGSAWVNHSWHVTLYVTARGLTTSPIAVGTHTFQIDFDFVDHRLLIQTSDGRASGFGFEPMSVAAFHARLAKELDKLDIRLRIHPLPNEIENPIRFDQDEEHRAYDAEYANRFWRVLVQADRVFKQFREVAHRLSHLVHYFTNVDEYVVVSCFYPIDLVGLQEYDTATYLYADWTRRALSGVALLL